MSAPLTTSVEFCYECPDFPCPKLAPVAERAQELPHNTEVYNLILLSKRGVEEGMANAEERGRQYFRAKKLRGDDPV